MTSNQNREELRQFVADVLQSVSEPYSASVPDTNTIFWLIYRNQEWLRRYHELESKYRSINSPIARQVAKQTGQTEVHRSSINKCRLIKSLTYAILAPKA